MNDATCDKLDDYLDSDMSPDTRAAFEAHLAGCVACRRAVEVHQNTYALLRHATIELEKPSREIVVGIETRLRQLNRRRFMRAISIATAAAILLIGTGVWFGNLLEHDSLQRAVAHRKNGTEPTGTIHRTESPSDLSTQARVQLHFDTRHDAIAIPVGSDDPSVSIFLVYPIQSYSQDASEPEPEPAKEMPRSKT